MRRVCCCQRRVVVEGDRNRRYILTERTKEVAIEFFLCSFSFFHDSRMKSRQSHYKGFSNSKLWYTPWLSIFGGSWQKQRLKAKENLFWNPIDFDIHTTRSTKEFSCRTYTMYSLCSRIPWQLNVSLNSLIAKEILDILDNPDNPLGLTGRRLFPFLSLSLGIRLQRIL
jgi:hypothetical protein